VGRHRALDDRCAGGARSGIARVLSDVRGSKQAKFGGYGPLRAEGEMRRIGKTARPFESGSSAANAF
jgi:hypothetical protein